LALHLTDLVAPEFLGGPLSRIRFIPFLEVASFNTAWNDDAVVYSGVTTFGEDPADLKDLEFQNHALGPVFHPGTKGSLKDLNILFRLTIPRRGSPDISSVVDPNKPEFASLAKIFGDLGEVPLTSKPNSDYPGTAFRLELLFRTLTLRLPPSFKPAKLDSEGMLVPDVPGPVEILLPNIALQISQDDKWGDPKVSLLRRGVEGLDDLFDEGAGQLVSMDPAWTLHDSGAWGFGFESAILDLSDKVTPPQILAKFGTGEDFQGLYFPQVRLYAAPNAAKGLEFAVYANDLVIDFNNGVSGEFGLDIEKPDFMGFVPGFSTSDGGPIVQTIDRDKRILTRTTSSMTYTSRVDLNPAQDYWLSFPVYQGGVPPYTVLVNGDLKQGAVGASPFWKIPAGAKLITIVGQDSGPSPLKYRETIRVEPKAGLGQVSQVVRCKGLIPSKLQPLDGFFYLDPIQNQYALAVTPGALSGGQIKIPYGTDPKVPVSFHLDSWAVTYASILLPNSSILLPIPYPSATPPSVSNIQAILAPINWSQVLADPNLVPPPIFLETFCQEYEFHPPFGNPFQAEATARAAAQTRLNNVRQALVNSGVSPANIQTQVSVNGYTFERHEVYVSKQIRDQHHTIDGTVFLQIKPERQAKIRKPDSNFFRALHLRIRLERNHLVLFEIRGKFDFQTASERAQKQINPPPDPVKLFGTNPDDGLTEFRITVTHDTATGTLTEEVALISAATDTDGLLHTKTESTGVNAFATFLAVAPLLADASNSSTPGPMKFAGPVALGVALAAAIKNAHITLYGGEAHSTQNLDTHQFQNLQLFLDYGISFGLELKLGDVLTLTTEGSGVPNPVTVRYKAVGAELDFHKDTDGKTTLAPLFDPSKGYEFGLADPGQLTIKAVGKKIITATAFRVARINPIVLQADLTLNLNLGVVSVDSFRVTAKFDGDNPPVITVQGIGVTIDIPGTIKGRGYLKFLDGGGFEGSMDLTLVSVKLRVSASVRVAPIPPGKTGVFVGVEVEFPAAIPIAGCGIALKGVLGMFAMHYDRSPAPQIAALPASLCWLQEFAEDPRGPTSLDAWSKPAPGSWAIGLGVLLVTQDGGFILNLKGIIIFQMPGPRILILAVVGIVSTPPALKGKSAKTRIIGVVDLDFLNHQLTIGALVDYSVQNLIALHIPVAALFHFRNPPDWYFHLGTFSDRITAELSLAKLVNVKATAYLMLEGKDLAGFPTLSGPVTLPGFAIALGFSFAAELPKNPNAKVRLAFSAALDVAVSINPFQLIGVMQIRGELHLFVVTIAAWATLQVKVYNPVYISGEICGEVKFRFFKLKGCIKFNAGEDGSSSPNLPELDLGWALQARSPALVEGQGTDRPVDGTYKIPDPVKEPGKLAIVPIDVLPVLHLRTAPILGTSFGNFKNPGQPPRALPDGKLDLGGGLTVKYADFSVTLTGISNANNLTPTVFDSLPASWRADTPVARGQDTAIDLALLTWESVSNPRATPLSDDLDAPIRDRWDHACKPLPPPARILWTFHAYPLGPSTKGWPLRGVLAPDPPNCFRSSSPDLNLLVNGLQQGVNDDLKTAWQTLSGSGSPQPAVLVGDDAPLPSAAMMLAGVPTSVLVKPGALTFVWQIGQPLPAAQTLVVGPVPAGWRFIASATTATGGNWLNIEPLGTSLPLSAGMGSVTATIKKTDLAPGLYSGSITLNSATGATVTVPVTLNAIAVGASPYNLRRRVLRMPRLHPSPVTDQMKSDGRLSPEPIVIQSGPVESARFLIACLPASLPSVFLSATATPTTSVNLTSLSPTPLPTEAILWTTWLLPPAEWRPDLQRAYTFLKTMPELTCYYVEWKSPPKGIADLRLSITTPAGAAAAPDLVFLGAVDLLRSSEPERFQRDQATQQSDRNAIVKLVAPLPQPLLDPGTEYKIVILHTRNGVSQPTEKRFKTDSEPPKRLDPWILATSPFADQAFFFLDEPVQFWFNHPWVVDLFARYGRKLTYLLWESNRSEVPARTSVPIQPKDLKDNAGPPILNPYERKMRGRLADFGCLHSDPTIIPPLPLVLPNPNKQLLLIDPKGPNPLLPSATYTLEVHAEPDPTPIFTLSFSTSRYASVAALGQAVKAAPISHSILKAPLAPPAGLKQMPISDIEFQNMLIASGVPFNYAPADPRTTMLWAANGAAWKLAAFLIETPEPLWRFRPVPTLQTIVGPDGNFQQYVNTPFMTLGIEDNSMADRFLFAFGGTRTLILLKPLTIDAPMTLNLKRTQHELLPNLQADTPVALWSAVLSNLPPWSHDEE
jgi:hypothetical protein